MASQTPALPSLRSPAATHPTKTQRSASSTCARCTTATPAQSTTRQISCPPSNCWRCSGSRRRKYCIGLMWMGRGMYWRSLGA
ncbi:hypothetical protein EMPG_12988 [Blastomyces silverae]|uniref:Uncharacterized protein n=1 Tax=Blastomyces silverae TaxID=2060906 RepID=A0A0H1BRV4_9EURO|nr:hypothetical protein EMPG_12988 [Blastomyces silverae]